MSLLVKIIVDIAQEAPIITSPDNAITRAPAGVLAKAVTPVRYSIISTLLSSELKTSMLGITLMKDITKSAVFADLRPSQK